jgi:hypothetical protein
MVNRYGIGSLMRNGPAPGRAGLSALGQKAHVADREMVLPNMAMRRDPSLREHAMRSMARMGRNPAQYVVGSGRNSRNPTTGAMEYADMFYDPNAGGWVTGTGAPIDFSASNDSFANTGTADASSPFSQTAPYPSAADRAAVAAFVQNRDTSGRDYSGSTLNNDPVERAKYYEATTPTAPEEPAPVYQQPEAGPPKFYPPQPGTPKTYGGNTSTYAMDTEPALPSLSPSTPEPTLADVQAAPQQQQAAPDFSPWNSPQTYDQWRDTRNPSGKGVQNTLYGQTTGAGVALQPMTMGDSGGMGQMPVGNPVPWSIPGTALGFGAANTGTDPSILNNGYQNAMTQNYGSFMPNALAGLFGGNQNGGIAFSGQGQQPFGQQYGGTGTADFPSLFRY